MKLKQLTGILYFLLVLPLCSAVTFDSGVNLDGVIINSTTTTNKVEVNASNVIFNEVSQGVIQSNSGEENIVLLNQEDILIHTVNGTVLEDYIVINNDGDFDVTLLENDPTTLINKYNCSQELQDLNNEPCGREYSPISFFSTQSSGSYTGAGNVSQGAQGFFLSLSENFTLWGTIIGLMAIAGVVIYVFGTRGVKI